MVECRRSIEASAHTCDVDASSKSYTNGCHDSIVLKFVEFQIVLVEVSDAVSIVLVDPSFRYVGLPISVKQLDCKRLPIAVLQQSYG